MKVRYTDTALAEIEDILAHIAKDNPLAADEVAAVMRVTIARLSDHHSECARCAGAPLSVSRVLQYRKQLARDPKRAPRCA
jgi:plasmid stabilization system protein ParE